MLARTTPDDRRRFYEAHIHGASYRQIAEAASVSLACVRFWCRRLRKGGSCLTTPHGRPAGLLQSFDPKVRFAILRLRVQHPRWGPGRIQHGLQQRPSLRCLALPSRAQIGRYLQRWPRLRRPAAVPRPPTPRPQPPTQVHECWQIDFKMGWRLARDQLVNLHTICDPVGEVCIAARVTPAGRRGRRPQHVTLHELQDTVRQGVEQWHTLPQRVQVDGEAVFIGHPDDAFPSRFRLWLLGLQVDLVRTRPGKPTDNAEVERWHHTLCDYALVGNEQLSASQLQQQLATALALLAFELPSRAAGCGGQPPVQAHPELLQPPQPFLPEHELCRFDLDRVDRYLAAQTWSRRVGKTGQLCLGGWHQYYSIGRRHAGQRVRVTFDPHDRHFVFSELAAPFQELARRPARELDVASLTGLAAPGSLAVPQQLSLFSLLAGVSC